MIAAFRCVLRFRAELNGLRHSNVVVYLPQSGDRLRDDLHSKLLFFVTNKGQWNEKSGPNVADGNVAMRTKISGRLESK